MVTTTSTLHHLTTSDAMRQPNFHFTDYGFLPEDNYYYLPINPTQQMVAKMGAGSYALGIRQGNWVKPWWSSRYRTTNVTTIWINHRFFKEDELIALYGVLTGKLLTKQQPYK